MTLVTPFPYPEAIRSYTFSCGLRCLLNLTVTPLPRFNPLLRAQKPHEPTIQLPRVLNIKDPYTLLLSFFTEQHFEMISANTGLYAAQHEAGKPRKRPWQNITASAIKSFIGILIYMRIVELDLVEDYWSQDVGRFGVFTCSQKMSLTLFENIKRFLLVSPPESQDDSKIPTDESSETTKNWWYKLEPLASDIREWYH